jgi:hypothetical protein
VERSLEHRPGPFHVPALGPRHREDVLGAGRPADVACGVEDTARLLAGLLRLVEPAEVDERPSLGEARLRQQEELPLRARLRRGLLRRLRLPLEVGERPGGLRLGEVDPGVVGRC